jgi:DNA polymerase (family 10)
MQLERAKGIANECVEKLRPYCEKIAIAGSIRRLKPLVNDIDLVLIPSNQGQVAYQLAQMGKNKMNGPKIVRVAMGFTKGIDLDVYIATPETWATLLLIRTGSADHNHRLCMKALNMGMKLHADGRGLFKGDECIASESEEAIFQGLGMPFKRPEERE